MKAVSLRGDTEGYDHRLNVITDLSYTTDLYFDIIVGAPLNVPTLSEWSMIIMCLLLLASGTVGIIRRRKASAAGAG